MHLGSFFRSLRHIYFVCLGIFLMSNLAAISATQSSHQTISLSSYLRIRIMTLDGKAVIERSQSMRVDPLSTKIYDAPLFPEMLGKLGVNPGTVLVDADLAVHDQTVSTNVLDLVPVPGKKGT
jgi:hypothetical protein